MQHKGWIRASAQAAVAYRIEHDTILTLPSSFLITPSLLSVSPSDFQAVQESYCVVTAISVKNTTNEPLVVTWVGVNGQQVYPPIREVSLIPQNVPPGAFQRLNVEPIRLPLDTKINVSISLKGERTGRWDNVETTFSPATK